MAQIEGKYMVVRGTTYKVKVPWQATGEQLAATRHRVEWLAQHNGEPFPLELLEEFVTAKIPTISEWQRKLALARELAARQLRAPLLGAQLSIPLPVTTIDNDMVEKYNFLRSI